MNIIKFNEGISKDQQALVLQMLQSVCEISEVVEVEISAKETLIGNLEIQDKIRESVTEQIFNKSKIAISERIRFRPNTSMLEGKIKMFLL